VSSKDKLFALINATNPLPRPLTANNVELIDPRPAVGTGWNTRVTIRAIPDKGYSREQDVFYRRIDLADLEPIVYKSEDVTTPATLLALINARRGTWMEMEDVQPFTMPLVPQGGEASVVIAAADESYCFIGQATVTLRRKAVVPAAGVVAATVLPNPDTEETVFTQLQRFTVSLSQATSNPVSLGIRTVDGTAIAGVDYDDDLQLLNFLPGETTKTFDVAFKQGVTGKTFSVLLSDPTDATIVVPTATANVEPLPLPAITISVSNAGIVDGAYTVEVHRAAYPAVTAFQLYTVNGTAIGGDFYEAKNFMDQFAAGETLKTYQIAVYDGAPGETLDFTVVLGNVSGGVLGDPSEVLLLVPELAVPPAVLTVADATLELIGDGGAINFVTAPAAVFNTVALPLRGPFTDDAVVWEERAGVGVQFVLDRVLVSGERLELFRKTAAGDAYVLVQTGGLVFDAGAQSGYIPDPTYNAQGPSYPLEADGEVYYRMLVRDTADTVLATSADLRLDILAENPEVVEMFLDTFSTNGTLNAHVPDVNVLASYNWPAGDGVVWSGWSAEGTDPVTQLTGGRLVMGSSNEAPIILAPGEDSLTHEANAPIPEAHVGSFTTTFVWRSPRTAAQDRLLTDNGYPIQLSVGKSDVTLAVDEYRTTIGFTINANDGAAAKTLAFYGQPPVAIDYAANTDYVGTLVVEPGKRTLDFLGVHLETEVDLETESKRHLIIGPLYLHMGENCQLDDLRIVTGRHYAAV
jgi:hypothetical protein